MLVIQEAFSRLKAYLPKCDKQTIQVATDRLSGYEFRSVFQILNKRPLEAGSCSGHSIQRVVYNIR